MKRLAVLAITFFAASAFALDPIWDMHYTFGPESHRAPKFGAGVGLRSDFDSHVLFPANIMGTISKDFEIGAKIDIDTYNQMDNTQLSLDIGGKYHLQPGRFIELDGYFGRSDSHLRNGTLYREELLQLLRDARGIPGRRDR